MDDTRLTYRPGDATIWRDDELVADVRVERFGPMLVRAFNAHAALVTALEEQIELWTMAKPALDLADARQHLVKFTELHDPIGLLRTALEKARQ